IIPRVTEINADIRSLAGGAGTKLGTGGMVTKIHAAEVCFESGIPMVITNGSRIENAYDILAGHIPGTLFMKD
ncbi:MAG: glutamate 5-kinase, partial [Oscillospiraceae bacterium]|nr:glutamate 5-kinase [Oscillospiraceae bacterium]